MKIKMKKNVQHRHLNLKTGEVVTVTNVLGKKLIDDGSAEEKKEGRSIKELLFGKKSEDKK